MKSRLCSLKEIIHYVYLSFLSIFLIVSLSAPWYYIRLCTSSTGCLNILLQNSNQDLDSEIASKVHGSHGLTVFCFLLVVVKKSNMATNFYQLARKISIWSRYGIQALLFIFVAAACFNFTRINKVICGDTKVDEEATHICNSFSGHQNITTTIKPFGTTSVSAEWGPKSGYVFSALSVVLVWCYVLYLVFVFWSGLKKSKSSKPSAGYYNPNQQQGGGGSRYSQHEQQGRESLISHNPDDYNLANEI
ncbi:hypothetical protein DFA_11524 [Cavenderia fasciculata]|uniref:Transmembrane protein n=1 Tax=Cavenderia fasciculata TaxID=261658 RepID=F4QDD5_CACFS|nr:uncharacterized protein DFA_11524 [Cavenderia fasciculata]EGG13763.1 hypothetical protein DFA_11524 [Cavenderia fasciculata]|eukprot:XP_004350471.1 hypothetical protein DFA_11524 [Cavenderia fasciculata]